MNQRIQELAIKAGFFYEDYKDIWYLEYHNQTCEEEMKKFAELIVRECMNVLDPGEHQLIARFQARQMLSEHFGVDSQPVSNVDRILQTVRTRGQ
jgi:hypothetical protein